MIALILAAATAGPWAVIAAVSAAIIALVGSVYAVRSQRSADKRQQQNIETTAELKKQEDVLAANVSTQVNLTKDVLDNWKGIVTHLGTQITDLHGQVLRLEERERKCQSELMDQKARLMEIEVRVGKDAK